MTTLQLRRLKTLNALGLNDQQIAEEIGASGSQVYYWRHYKLRLPCYGSTRRRPYSDYTIYDREGNVRAFGTAQECAKALGCKVHSIYEMASRSKKRGDGRIVREEKCNGR